jgi:hypothetical protein
VASALRLPVMFRAARFSVLVSVHGSYTHVHMYVSILPMCTMDKHVMVMDDTSALRNEIA